MAPEGIPPGDGEEQAGPAVSLSSERGGQETAAGMNWKIAEGWGR